MKTLESMLTGQSRRKEKMQTPFQSPIGDMCFSKITVPQEEDRWTSI
ncbi:MAG: hypothetical protein AB1499_02185 [Nitrospirota bacterium]